MQPSATMAAFEQLLALSRKLGMLGSLPATFRVAGTSLARPHAALPR